MGCVPLGGGGGKMTEFDTKLRFLAKQIVWIIVFVLMSPFCLWGIFTGIQYMNDECVRDGAQTIALDWWLVIVSVYNLCFAVIVLVLLCCHTRSRIRKFIIWPLHAFNLFWLVIGILLIIESDIKCKHNTLWIACVVNVSITGAVALVLFCVWLLNRIGLCNRLGRYMSLEETPYDTYLTDRSINEDTF